MEGKNNITRQFRILETLHGDATQEFPESERGVVREVVGYLRHVASGGGRGKPLCPFTPGVLARNGFHLRVVAGAQSEFNLDEVARSVSDELALLSPGRVGHGVPTDLKAVAVAFAHPSCREEDFYRRLTDTHTQVRHGFLERGQMLSAMFETHADSDGTDAFRSSVPLLLARRMHKGDIKFMRNPAAQEVFSSFFPGADFGNPDLPCTCAPGQPISPSCLKHGRRS